MSNIMKMSTTSVTFFIPNSETLLLDMLVLLSCSFFPLLHNSTFSPGKSVCRIIRKQPAQGKSFSLRFNDKKHFNVTCILVCATFASTFVCFELEVPTHCVKKLLVFASFSSESCHGLYKERVLCQEYKHLE